MTQLTSCPDCGGQVSLRAQTCPHCGAPLGTPPATQGQPAAAPAPPPAADGLQPAPGTVDPQRLRNFKKKQVRALLAFLAIVLLGGGGVGTWLFVIEGSPASWAETISNLPRLGYMTPEESKLTGYFISASYGNKVSWKFSTEKEQHGIYEGMWAITLRDPKLVWRSHFAPDASIEKILSEPPRPLPTFDEPVVETWYYLGEGPLDGALLLEQTGQESNKTLRYYVISASYACGEHRPVILGKSPPAVCARVGLGG